MKLGAEAIQELIPHRPPFLLVDEVLEVSGQRMLARKRADDPGVFRGHYPGNPIMPGVLICECCFQAGAILISHGEGGWSPERGLPVLTRITDARFKRIVRPGETIDLEVTMEDQLDNAYYLSGKASVDGEAVLRVQFVCMLMREGPQT